MKNFTRRDAIHMLTRGPLASSVILSGSLGRAMMALPTQQLENSVDWSKGVVDTTMSRFPDPKTLGAWGYAISLYLYGQYLVYKRTGEQKYLDYIRGWVDHLVSDEGVISRPISALDYVLPGNLLLILFQETRQEKYRKAAESIRVRFDTYPRTEDGGFWHALSRQHQLWLDGIFMSMPFLVRYGKLFRDETYTCDEAVKQILIYAKHLNDPESGLMYHAYDESGQQPWTDAATLHSSFFWGRAIGWFGMATIEVLEVLPHSHPHRKELIALVKQLSEACRKYQDPKTGLWYQVVDKGTLSGNWLETSCSSMYTYTLSRAVQRGYVSRKYLDAACHGYRGVLTQLSRDTEGHTHIANICEGTNVGDLNFYFQRPRKTDDFHGIGAFLIMNEQLRTTACAQKATSQVS